MFETEDLVVPPTLPTPDSLDLVNLSGNLTEDDEEVPWFRHSPALTSVFCTAYTLVFVVGVLGNSFVVAVVVRSPRMRTVTNYFIVNLALADILVLIFCLPATLLSNIVVPWVLGLFMCKSVSYLQGVSVSASINTLVAISIDRFVAICYPLKCQMTTGLARKVISLIWLFSLLVALPWALFFELESVDLGGGELASFCVERWPRPESEQLYFLLANLGLCYLLPLLVISLCYLAIWLKVWRRNIPGETKGTNADLLMQRSKLKVVKMMVMVVVLFVLSWLPLYAIFAMVKMGVQVEENSATFAFLVPVAQWLGASNSCINPVLYTFCNKKFRRGFRAVLRSRSCCANLRYAEQDSSSKVLRSTFKTECGNSSQV